MIQGSGGHKYKYVFTKIDKRPHYLIMDRCNHCPFLINDFQNSNAKCGKFVDTKSTSENYICRVHGYIQTKPGTSKMEILSEIPIPSWCGLPNHIIDISPNDNIHYIKNGKLIIESGQNYANTISIIKSDEIKYSNEDGDSLITKSKKSKYKYNKIKITPNTKLCSSCGEDKEDVDREVHNGMCKGCRKMYKKDKNKLYSSFINNFRLKRRESWKKEGYKVVNIDI